MRSTRIYTVVNSGTEWQYCDYEMCIYEGGGDRRYDVEQLAAA